MKRYIVQAVDENGKFKGGRIAYSKKEAAEIANTMNSHGLWAYTRVIDK